MEDGSYVLARLPYRSTLPRRLAVASEVATLNFVRAQGIPAPTVLGYSIGDNAVGSEYILMEKLPGTPLGASWYSLTETERLTILYQIIDMEAKLFAANLPANESIYFAFDLPTGVPKVDIPDSVDGLCVGPYAAFSWWFGERHNLDIDRGPREYYAASTLSTVLIL